MAWRLKRWPTSVVDTAQLNACRLRTRRLHYTSLLLLKSV